MTAPHAPDRPATVVALLNGNRELTRQRDLLAGLLVERIVAENAGPYGGTDALNPRTHQQLIDAAREHLQQLVVSDRRADELVRMGRGQR